uniref:Uncharacterized protein n=1 Tax=Caenorhabditis japonica TaxID=281687 RepID=A0A8R1IPK0_CAEJA
MSAVQKDGDTTNITNNNNNNNYIKQCLKRQRVASDAVMINVKDDIPMYGRAGYNKSWSIIQSAVDHLMTETTIPVPLSTIKMREPRHLVKRRINVDLYRDVLINNLILRTQNFQKSYEAKSQSFTRQVIIDYPTERQRPRKERHYEFWPYFEQLPDLEEEEQVEPEDVSEQEVHDTAGLFGFASDDTIEVAEECKETSTFLPAALSEDLTEEIAGLFNKEIKPIPVPSFVQKYMKRGPFARIF